MNPYESPTKAASSETERPLLHDGVPYDSRAIDTATDKSVPLIAAGCQLRLIR
jgi:hypothetical protein